jgi:hypothetical protein
LTTIKPPEKPNARVSGRSTNTSATSELMRHLLADISESDQRHLMDVVDRNHAEQLARKRRARAEALEDAGEQDRDEEDVSDY